MPSRRRAAMNSWSARRGRIEHDAFGAILAADAGPQGVVAIERDGFEGRRDDGVDFARQGGGEGHEIERRVGYAAQFVAVRIVDFGHRVEGGDLCGGEEVDGGQAGDAARGLRRRTGWRRDTGRRCRGTAVRPAAARTASTNSAAWAAAQSSKRTSDDVDAAGIAGEETGGVEQFLKDLVVGGEAEFGGKSEFAHPEGQTGLDGFGSKRGADRDVQIPLY